MIELVDLFQSYLRSNSDYLSKGGVVYTDMISILP